MERGIFSKDASFAVGYNLIPQGGVWSPGVRLELTNLLEPRTIYLAVKFLSCTGPFRHCCVLLTDKSLPE